MNIASLLQVSGESIGEAIPRALTSYQDSGGLLEILAGRIEAEPFNLVTAIIFVCAIVHTFFAGFFRKIGHDIQEKHVKKLIEDGSIGKENQDVSFWGRIFHFLGEVEAIFGIWVIALIVAICVRYDWHTAVEYLSHKVVYTEALFVVVIMAIASTRPILNLAENSLRILASLGGQKPSAWWLSILIVAPLLGSFITEPAAITIAALLLGKQFYVHKPSVKFKYATIGLLFVNISVGGTFTNFAAPPVLMVAAPWEWTSGFMAIHFGWKALVGILIATGVYYMMFISEFKRINTKLKESKEHKEHGDEVTSDDLTDLVPWWVTLVHVLFMGWTVFNAHYPVLFIGGFLFFLGFMHATEQHQNRLKLESPILVGFFLAGLVTHGGLQGWWIEPVLGGLGSLALFTVSTVLTSFNDNAAITYLSTLVPGLSDTAKYAVVAGAVTGGGLTVIANAPNPAGQSILSKYFPNKMVSPIYLLAGAMVPTLILFGCFWFL